MHDSCDFGQECLLSKCNVNYLGNEWLKLWASILVVSNISPSEVIHSELRTMSGASADTQAVKSMTVMLLLHKTNSKSYIFSSVCCSQVL